jgi:hypothetical protein
LAHKTQDEHKQKQNTTEKKDEHNGPHQKITLNPDPREILAVPTSYTVNNIDKSCKNLKAEKTRKKSVLTCYQDNLKGVYMPLIISILPA